MAGQYSDGNDTGSRNVVLRDQIRGLYPITPDCADDDRLFALVEPVLASGISLLQYRNKTADATRRRAQLAGLLARCRAAGVLLIVNDDWRLALDLGAEAIHVGRDDGDPAVIRRAVGSGVLIGVSCYASLERARELIRKAQWFWDSVAAENSMGAHNPGGNLNILGQSIDLAHQAIEAAYRAAGAPPQ